MVDFEPRDESSEGTLVFTALAGFDSRNMMVILRSPPVCMPRGGQHVTEASQVRPKNTWWTQLHTNEIFCMSLLPVHGHSLWLLDDSPLKFRSMRWRLQGHRRPHWQLRCDLNGLNLSSNPHNYPWTEVNGSLMHPRSSGTIAVALGRTRLGLSDYVHCTIGKVFMRNGWMSAGFHWAVHLSCIRCLLRNV